MHSSMRKLHVSPLRVFLSQLNHLPFSRHLESTSVELQATRPPASRVAVQFCFHHRDNKRSLFREKKGKSQLSLNFPNEGQLFKDVPFWPKKKTKGKKKRREFSFREAGNEHA